MDKTALKIKIFGNPVLRKKARQVKDIDADRLDTLSKMARIMYAESGVGLAATQVGISEAMFVADIGNGLYKLINPRIVKRQGSQAIEEGCLSVPGVFVKVRRAKRVIVQAQDESGRPVTIEAQDLLARVFQHEIDHLNGKLIIDYASFLGRLKVRNKLAQLKKRLKEDEICPC